MGKIRGSGLARDRTLQFGGIGNSWPCLGTIAASDKHWLGGLKWGGVAFLACFEQRSQIGRRRKQFWRASRMHLTRSSGHCHVHSFVCFVDGVKCRSSAF